MCSTPRSKRLIKGKAKLSGSLLSNINSNARATFAQRANVADERRFQLKKEKSQQRQKHSRVSTLLSSAQSVKASEYKGRRYWLVSASLIELVRLLFLGSAKKQRR